MFLLRPTLKLSLRPRPLQREFASNGHVYAHTTVIPVHRFLSAERICVHRSRIRTHDSPSGPFQRATSIESHLNVSPLILSGHTQIAVFGPERHIQRRRHSGQLEYLAGPFIYRPSSLRFDFPTPLTPHTLCYSRLSALIVGMTALCCGACPVLSCFRDQSSGTALQARPLHSAPTSQTHSAKNAVS